MISASQNANTIVFWLQELLRTGALQTSTFHSPKEVVTDFDKALLGAVARVFAKSATLHDYLSTYFSLLIGVRKSKPLCLLRLDVCYFMNIVVRWKCFSGKPSIVKSFFMRAMAILRKQTTFHEFEEITRHIFIIVMNPCEDSNLTMRARNNLTLLIKGDTDALSINDTNLSTDEYESNQDIFNDIRGLAIK